MASSGTETSEIAFGDVVDYVERSVRDAVSAYRDMLCGEPRAEHAGRELTLSGWVGRRRDHGGLVFIDLRDRSGHRAARDRSRAGAGGARSGPGAAARVRRARARRARSRAARRRATTELPTGDVELAVEELELLSSSEVLPFQLDDENVDEALRIRHRYLDLRRPRMQELQGIRTRAVRSIRRFLDERGFLDLETPTMTRATPEGARDFVIPFRLEPGTFYALPQSPQLYKQLLMCGGFDRYYQIARCWRDEAQRADRALEFTQLDLEMSFVEQEDVLSLTEQLIAEVWRDAGHEVELPFPRAALRRGARALRQRQARPALRPRDRRRQRAGGGLGVRRLLARRRRGRRRALPERPGRGRGALAQGLRRAGRVRQGVGRQGPRLPHLRGRRQRALADREVPLARPRSRRSARPRAPARARSRSSRRTRSPVVERVLGALRPHLARRFELIPGRPVEVPLRGRLPALQAHEDGEGWTAEHHPFTAPKREHEELLESDPGAVLSEAYDMVLNGLEMASGSIRINRADLQTRVLDVIGIAPAEAEERFGFLLRALRFGAPPHGGIAPGIDRIAMQLGDTDNLREVVAFPKLGGRRRPAHGRARGRCRPSSWPSSG